MGHFLRLECWHISSVPLRPWRWPTSFFIPVTCGSDMESVPSRRHMLQTWREVRKIQLSPATSFILKQNQCPLTYMKIWRPLNENESSRTHLEVKLQPVKWGKGCTRLKNLGELLHDPTGYATVVKIMSRLFAMILTIKQKRQTWTKINNLSDFTVRGRP